MSNSLNPDQDQNSVGPGLAPNCLQRLSADDTMKEFITFKEYILRPMEFSIEQWNIQF